MYANLWDYEKMMEELKRLSGKRVQNVTIQIAEQLFNREKNFGDDHYELSDRLADQIYDSIRLSDTDICDFQKCQIIESDFSRTEFNDSFLMNCKFSHTNSRSSSFRRCELIETKIENSNLDLIISRSIKIWKLNQLIEIENRKIFPFKKVL